MESEKRHGIAMIAKICFLCSRSRRLQWYVCRWKWKGSKHKAELEGASSAMKKMAHPNAK